MLQVTVKWPAGLRQEFPVQLTRQVMRTLRATLGSADNVAAIANNSLNTCGAATPHPGSDCYCLSSS